MRAHFSIQYTRCFAYVFKALALNRCFWIRMQWIAATWGMG